MFNGASGYNFRYFIDYANTSDYTGSVSAGTGSQLPVQALHAQACCVQVTLDLQSQR